MIKAYVRSRTVLKMADLSKIKVCLKLGILGIDLYEIKSDDEEEKLERAFALVLDNKDLMKEAFDLVSKLSFKSVLAVGAVGAGSVGLYFLRRMFFNSLTLEILVDNDELLQSLKDQVETDFFKEELQRIYDKYGLKLGFEELSHEEIELKSSLQELEEKARDAVQSSRYLIDYKAKSITFCDIDYEEGKFLQNEKTKDVELFQMIFLNGIYVDYILPIPEEKNEENQKGNKTSLLSVKDLFESKDALEEYIMDVENTSSFELYSAPQLLDYYERMLKTDRFVEAKKSGDRLLNVLSSIEISPLEAWKYAFQLRKEEPLKSLFFYFFFMHLCLTNVKIATSPIGLITLSFQEISFIVETMVSEVKLSKHIVCQHIVKDLISFEGKLKKKFRKAPQDEDNVKVFAEENAGQYFYISRCQLAIHDYIGCERTLKKAIHCYEDAFSDDLSQTRLYGVFLHYLGISFWGRHLKEKANDYFFQARIELKDSKRLEPEMKNQILETNEKFRALNEPLEVFCKA